MRALWLSALAVLLADQASKLYVLLVLGLESVGRIEVFPPYLVFQMAWNRGINFGLFAGQAEALRWGLIGLALAISAGVVVWMRRGAQPLGARIAAGALVGGAIGNVIDRVAHGAVADFLNMSCCGFSNPFSFNVADIAIFAGAAGLVLLTGDEPGDEPGVGPPDPGRGAGPDRGQRPEERPDERPDERPEESFGQDPEQDPERDPEQTPEQGPLQSPLQSPAQGRDAGDRIG